MSSFAYQKFFILHFAQAFFPKSLSLPCQPRVYNANPLFLLLVPVYTRVSFAPLFSKHTETAHTHTHPHGGTIFFSASVSFWCFTLPFLSFFLHLPEVYNNENEKKKERAKNETKIVSLLALLACLSFSLPRCRSVCLPACLAVVNKVEIRCSSGRSYGRLKFNVNISKLMQYFCGVTWATAGPTLRPVELT